MQGFYWFWPKMGFLKYWMTTTDWKPTTSWYQPSDKDHTQYIRDAKVSELKIRGKQRVGRQVPIWAKSGLCPTKINATIPVYSVQEGWDHTHPSSSRPSRFEDCYFWHIRAWNRYVKSGGTLWSKLYSSTGRPGLLFRMFGLGTTNRDFLDQSEGRAS